MINIDGTQLFRIHSQLTLTPRDKSGSTGITGEPTFTTYAGFRNLYEALRNLYGVAPVASEFTGPSVSLVEKFVWTVDTGNRVITDTVWVQH